MSWSYSGMGKPEALIDHARSQFKGMSKCSEPEETIRQLALTQIELSLGCMPEKTVVKIHAYGSQGSYPDDKYINNLKVEIEPIYGFVE